MKGVMDLRQFFKKTREVEISILEQFPVVTSLETGDGGRPGVLSEVPRYQAARMIVEGKARLASEDEKQTYVEERAASQKRLDELEAARRSTVVLVTNPDQQRVSSSPKAPRK